MNRIDLLFLLVMNVSFSNGQDVLRSSKGFVSFLSDAPLEKISASSSSLQGIIDKTALTFAFSININSLKGFNSPLQQEHFYENYMETDRFPKAAYSGKIIEAISLDQNGTYELRGKGTLVIHGVKQNRIIKVQMEVSDQGIRIRSDFDLELKDHNIKVPRIVNQKIAPVIQVSVDAFFTDEKK